MMKRRILSIILSIATILSLLPTYTATAKAAEVTVPDADVLNIDFSSGDTADTNGHLVTEGTGVIETDTGLGTGVKALRMEANGGSRLGHRYAVTDSDYTKIESSFTMECYFNASSLVGEQAIFSGQEGGGIGFEIDGGKLVFYGAFHKSSGKAVYQDPSFSQISTNCWIHAVATYDGSTLRLYVNGTEVDNRTNLSSTMVLPGASSFFVFGDPNKNNESTYPMKEGGMVNCARLYSTALSAEQVKAAFEAMPGVKNAGIALEGDQNAASVTFGVLSDVHISNYDTLGIDARLKKALEYFADNGASSTIIAGDLTDYGNETQLNCYVTAEKAAETGDMTIHKSAGNHDRRTATKNFSQCIGESGWGHYKINGYHFILLSSENYDDVGNYDSSKAWLAEQLEIAEADTGDRPIFVFAHHAVKNTVFVSDEWYGNLTKEDFSEYPQVVLFTGHSHAPNNNPKSIWQGEFTAINTATISRTDMTTGYGNSVTPDGGKNFAQGLLVNVSGSEVTVTTRDFMSDEDVVDQVWTFDTAEVVEKGTEYFPYNNVRRLMNAKAPSFDEEAEITVDRITMPNVTVTFPQAKLDSSDAGDIVYAYRFEIWNSEGELVTNRKEWSDFYRTQRAETMTKTIPGLEEGMDYTMYIYPINAYAMEGDPISVFFNTQPDPANEADVFSVDFSKNGAADALGHELIQKGEPTIENNSDVDGNVAIFDGSDDGYMYKFTAEDYAKIEDSFTMELYYLPKGTGNGQCPFSGQATGGLGFEYKDDQLVFFARFNNNWTEVPIPVHVNQWNHVFVTYDGTEIRAYLNGSLQACVAQTGKLQPPKSNTSYKMVIGADVDGYEVIEGQNKCQVAYAKIYSTCRTAKADVLNVDFRTMGAMDAAGHETVTLGSPTIAANSILGSDTASFDGADDGYKYVLSEEDYAKVQNCFSAELYYKPNNLQKSTCPFSGQESGGLGFEHNGNALEFWVHFDGSYVSLPISVKEGEWNHVVATYDGMQLKVYLNGSLVGSKYQNGSFTIPPNAAARALVIGGDTVGGNWLEHSANCEVAVARLYSTTLSAKDVQKNFSNLASGGLVVSNRSASQMQDLTYGYTEGSKVTYTIKNAGNSTLSNLTAALSSGSDYFEVSGPGATTLEPGTTTTVTVTTKQGLSASTTPYAGTLTVSAYSGESVTETLSQTVNKATVVITALNQTAYVGESVPSLSNPQEGVHYSVTGLASGESLKTAPSLTYAESVNMSVPGVVTIKIQGAALQNSTNYNAIEYKTGALSIYSTSLPTADILDVDFNSVLSYQDTNGHTVKEYGSPTIAYNEALQRTTASFDGNDDAFAYALTEEDYQKIGDGFTMELYYKPSSLKKNTCPFSGQESGGLGYEHNGSVLQLWVHIGGDYVCIPISVEVNEWNHVAVTYDGTTLKAYLDGTLVNTVAASGDFGLPKATAEFMVIGADPNTSGIAFLSECEVGVARIYSTCLTARHVAMSYSKIGTGKSQIPAVEIYGTQEQLITLSDLKYSPDVDFAQPVTTFSNSLAQMSNAFALATSEESKKVSNGKTSFNNLASAAGFTSVTMDSPSSNDPDYATRYYTAETMVQRNGKACKVLLIAISDDCKEDKYAVSADFLNKENGNSALKTDKVYCVTAEAERIYSEIASKCSTVSQNQDYLFWVAGTNRGSSVGNELAHLLVDAYGTSHTQAYLFGGMNVSTLAKTSEETSKYNCIYNILDLDDLITYLPLGADYNGWGYKRWGVTIRIGLPTNATERSSLKSDVSVYYQQYTGTIDRSSRSYIDASYLCYDYYNFSEANGADIKSVLDKLYAVMPTSKAYYTTEISYYNSSGEKKTKVCYDFISDLITGVLQLTEGDTSSFDLNMLKEVWGYYKEIKYSSENTCDVQPLLQLVLRHGLHASKISDVVSLNSLSDLLSLNSKKFVLKEAAIHTLPETYLSVMSITDPSRAMTASLPDSGAVDTLTADPFVLIGDKAFYNDQKFTVTLENGVYHLAFTYSDDTKGDLYGDASLYLLSETDNISSISYSDGSGAYQTVPITYQAAQKRYRVDVPSVNGNLKLEYKLDKPTFPQEGGADKSFVYTGAEQTLTLVGFDANTMNISGNVHTDANATGYTVTVVPKAGYAWSTEGACTFTWKIAPRTLTVTADNAAYYYDGEAHGASAEDSYELGGQGLADGQTISGVTVSGSKTEAGTYTGVLVPSGAVITDGGSKDVTENYDITYVNGDLTIYSLNSISVTTAPKTEYVEGQSFDSDGMVVMGNYSDGSSIAITGYTVDKTVLTASDTKVIVSYLGKTAEIDITVTVKPLAEDLKFKARSVMLGNSLTVIYKAEIGEDYTNPYVVFTLTPAEGEPIQQTVTEYVIDETTGRYCFYFSGITPQLMNANISAILYAEKDEQQYCHELRNYSIREYLTAISAKSANEAYFPLIASLLKYGEKAQQYAQYDTDNLVSASFADFIGQYAVDYAAGELKPTVQNITRKEGSKVHMKTVGLALDNAVDVRIGFTADETVDMSKVVIKAELCGRTVDITSFTAAELALQAGSVSGYYASFNGVAATEFDDTVTFRVYYDGRLCETLEYTVNTYLESHCAEETTQGALCRSLYNYGCEAGLVK